MRVGYVRAVFHMSSFPGQALFLRQNLWLGRRFKKKNGLGL